MEEEDKINREEPKKKDTTFVVPFYSVHRSQNAGPTGEQGLYAGLALPTVTLCSMLRMGDGNPGDDRFAPPLKKAVHQAESYPAQGIAQGNGEHPQQYVAAPYPCHREVVHIGNAVLKAAQDEDHYPKKLLI